MGNDPWADIEENAATGKLRARRAQASHPHDFFWARDAKGRRLFVYRYQGLDSETPLPNLRGIAIELTDESLVLRLQDSSDLEIFTALCLSVLERTRRVPSSSQVLDSIITHLERWQRFLGQNDNGLLSDEEVRGLLGEVAFLEGELMKHFGPGAVRFWHGPEGEPQDYAVGSALFEIKTRSSGSQSILMISSAEQLWSDAGELYLICYTVSETSEGSPGALSLADLINRTRQRIDQAELVEVFEDRISQVGYFDHPNYKHRFFEISGPDYFAVKNDFPRILPTDIPAGVCKVKYGIELSACLPFTTTVDWTRLGANDGA